MIFQIWSHADGGCRSLVPKDGRDHEIDQAFARLEGTENVLMHEFSMDFDDVAVAVGESLLDQTKARLIWAMAREYARIFWSGYDAHVVEPHIDIDVSQGMFEVDGSFTSDASMLSRRVASALRPILDDLLRHGHSIHEVSHVMMLGVVDLESATFLDKGRSQ